MAPFKIIFGSDFAPIRKFAPLMAAEPEAVYGDLLPILRAADYRLYLEDGSRNPEAEPEAADPPERAPYLEHWNDILEMVISGEENPATNKGNN